MVKVPRGKGEDNEYTWESITFTLDYGKVDCKKDSNRLEFFCSEVGQIVYAPKQKISYEYISSR